MSANVPRLTLGLKTACTDVGAVDAAPLGTMTLEMAAAIAREIDDAAITIQNHGVDVPKQPKLNFVGDLYASDDAGNARTNVSVSPPPALLSSSSLLFTFPRLATVSASIGKCPQSAGVWARMQGDPSTLYTLTLRFRGVFETPTAPPGGTLISTGVNNGVARIYRGGAPATNWYSNFSNRYRLEISDPSDYWYLNATNGADNGNGTQYLDQTIAVTAYGNAIIRLCAFADYEDLKLIPAGDQPGTEQRNDAGSSNTPISLPDVAGLSSIVASQPYDGQFCQMDVLSVS